KRFRTASTRRAARSRTPCRRSGGPRRLWTTVRPATATGTRRTAVMAAQPAPPGEVTTDAHALGEVPADRLRSHRGAGDRLRRCELRTAAQLAGLRSIHRPYEAG